MAKVVIKRYGRSPRLWIGGSRSIKPPGRAGTLSVDYDRGTKENLRIPAFLLIARDGSPRTQKSPACSFDPEETESPARQRSGQFDSDFFEDG